MKSKMMCLVVALAQVTGLASAQVPARGPVCEVRAGGVRGSVARRRTVRPRVVAQVPRPTVDALADTFSYGGLGQLGNGWGGGAGDSMIGMGGIGTLGQPPSPPVHDTGLSLRSRGTTGPVIRPIDPTRWIRSVVQERLSTLTVCHERFFARATGREGMIHTRFTIRPDGQTVNASITEIDQRLDQPSFRGCVVEAINRWQFVPPSNQGVTSVTYPFVFGPLPVSAPDAPAK